MSDAEKSVLRVLVANLCSSELFPSDECERYFEHSKKKPVKRRRSPFDFKTSEGKVDDMSSSSHSLICKETFVNILIETAEEPGQFPLFYRVLFNQSSSQSTISTIVCREEEAWPVTGEP